MNTLLMRGWCDLRGFEAGALALLVSWMMMGPCFAAEPEEIPLHEITSKQPDQVQFLYSFPSPIDHVAITFGRGDTEDTLANAEIRFGTQALVALPKSLVKCLPRPMVEVAAFLYVDFDASKSDWHKDWWSSLSFPYGREAEPPEKKSTETAVKVYAYPQVEFEFRGVKLTTIVLRRSPTEIRKIDPGRTSCPTEDIAWSIAR